MLRAEIVKSIRGESPFDSVTLNELIQDANTKCAELLIQHEQAKVAYNEGKAVMESLDARYNELIGWAELYDSANIETKKMIVNSLIKRIDVYRSYRVHVEFNIDFEQFQFGLDLNGKEENIA